MNNEFIIFITAFFMGMFVGYIMCKDIKGDFKKLRDKE